jgi:hypothetical protein
LTNSLTRPRIVTRRKSAIADSTTTDVPPMSRDCQAAARRQSILVALTALIPSAVPASIFVLFLASGFDF